MNAIARTDELYIPTYIGTQQAHDRSRPYIHRTPVLTSTFMNEPTGTRGVAQDITL